MTVLAPFTAAESEALTAALRAQARGNQPLAYLALAEAIDLTGPHRIHRLTEALESLAEADHAAGRPLLATLATGRFGLPGRGFFQLLRRLGRYQGADEGAEAAAAYARELAAAVAYWG